MNPALTRVGMSMLLLGLVACAPQAPGDGDNGSGSGALTTLTNNGNALVVTLTEAHPTTSITFNCSAALGKRCGEDLDFGIAESSLPRTSLTAASSDAFGGIWTYSLFDYSLDNTYVNPMGWMVPQPGNTTGFMAWFENAVSFNATPGPHLVTLARDASLPPGFPDVVFHLTAKMTVDDGPQSDVTGRAVTQVDAVGNDLPAPMPLADKRITFHMESTGDGAAPLPDMYFTTGSDGVFHGTVQTGTYTVYVGGDSVPAISNLPLAVGANDLGDLTI